VNLEALYSLIKRFEGCRLTPYLCPAGVWTCGWGSTGPDVFPGRPWTQEYADQRLKADAMRFTKITMQLCPSLEGLQLCAITDFAYNLGAGSLRHSTLRKCINNGDMESAVRELAKWVNGGGKRLPGLVSRRSAEAALLRGA
jgi:lysozyme